MINVRIDARLTPGDRLLAAAIAMTCVLSLTLATGAGAVDLRDWGRKFPASERFVVLSQFGNQAVLDKETQLVWQRAPSSETRVWRAAKFGCATLQLSGRWGWRLPSVHELSSLAQLGFFGAVLPAGHPFLNVQVGEYWTATQFADDKEQGAVFTMHFGESGSVDAVNALALDEPLHFWCVRGSGPISEY